MKHLLILIPLNLIFLALRGLAESTPPEPVPMSEGSHPSEAATGPAADKPALLWRDARTKRILFTSKDIISFDWEKQVFLLKAHATMDFLAWIPPHVHQAREMILEDMNGPIYEAHWVNNISSLGFSGPVYNALSPNPFFSIENGYPSGGNAAGRDKDARFSPRMRAGLEKSGVLESINLTKMHIGLAVQTTRNEWMNTGEDLKVRVEYFNDTFRIGRKARAHVFFAGGEKTRTRVDSLTLEIKFLANNGTLRTDNKIERIPISTIGEGIYVCEFDPWLATKGSDKQAEPGTGVVSLTVLLQKKEGENERTVHRLDFDERHVPIGGKIEAGQASPGASATRATGTEEVRIELGQRADEPRYVELTLPRFDCWWLRRPGTLCCLGRSLQFRHAPMARKRKAKSDA